MDDTTYLTVSDRYRRYRICEVSDSGQTLPAALIGAASYWGIEADPADLLRRFPSLATEDWDQCLPEVGRHLGVEFQLLSSSENAGNLALTPTVLVARGRAYLGIRDSYFRRRTYLCLVSGREAAIPLGDHQLIVVTRKLAASSSPKRLSRILSLAWSTPGFRHSIAAFSAITLCLELFALLAPLQLQIVIDHAIPNHDLSLIYLVAIGFLASATIQSLLQWSRGQLINWLNSSIAFQWSSAIFGRLLLLPYAYFQASTAGSIVTSFASLQQILRSLTSTLVSVLFDGVVSIAMLAVMYFFSPLLASIVVGFVVLNAALKLVWTRLANPRRKDLIDTGARQQSLLIDAIRGMHSIKANDGEASFRALYRKLAAVSSAKNMSLLSAMNTVAQSATYVLTVQRIVIIMLAAKSVLDGSFTIGILVAFVAYAEAFSSRSAAFSDRLSEIWGLEPHFDRVLELFSEPKDQNYCSRYVGETGGGGIILAGVRFTYPNSSREIIRGGNMEINGGDVVGVSAPSGSGKSTVAKLLVGLYEPTGGSILLGGRSIHELGAHRWRSRIALVSQDDVLFPGPIAANISGFDLKEDLGRVIRAARLACVHDDIAAFPCGYSHELKTGSADLSTGQRQRLLIARALYRDPDVVILDEATSNLDVGTEDRVLNNLIETGKTLVVISHREQALQHSNKRFTLEVGVLKEVAT